MMGSAALWPHLPPAAAAAAIVDVAAAPSIVPPVTDCGPDGILCGEGRDPQEVAAAQRKLSGQGEPAGDSWQATGGSDFPARAADRQLMVDSADAGIGSSSSLAQTAPAELAAPTPGSSPSLYASGLDPEVEKLLVGAGRRVESFAPEFSGALGDGRVTPAVLARYLELEGGPAQVVWWSQGFRERLLADPSFPVKVGIECGIGVCTKVAAEKTKRGAAFWNEIDFVAANVMMAIIADFMLTWLPAPTLSFATAGGAVAGPRAGFPLLLLFDHCPDNAFQRVQPGTIPFTVVERCGAVIRNGAKLLGVGFGASLLGVGLANAIIAVRMRLVPGWAPPNTPQSVLQTSGAYAVYMAVSSNLRYQVLAGVIEERGIETVFAGNARLCNALSLVVRTSNTFLGSLLWLDFVRLLGMQKGSGKGEEVSGGAAAGDEGRTDGVVGAAEAEVLDEAAEAVLASQGGSKDEAPSSPK
ncbi:hypothetical protein FOA52_000190 [Chlamydomonas sp. UWO 241]|nr:hypothetical protein FOA52_000190 [Chlamydomonas sp. UWO 241]